MSEIKRYLVGHWKIIWMEQWDQDFVDMDVPGHITIGDDGACHFQFGLVQGGFHIEPEDAYFDCDWGGSDECDEAFGDIHAAIEEGELRGEISFHCGDESEFRAVRQEKKKRRA